MLKKNNTIYMAVIILVNTVALAAAGDTSHPGLPDSQRLDDALAKQVYNVTEKWVTRGSVPEKTFAVVSTDIAGVHVTIRTDGLTLGQSTEIADDPLLSTKRRDLMEMVRRATGKALVEIEKNISNLSSRLGKQGIDQSISQLGPSLELEIQFAKTPQLINLQSMNQLPRKFTLGYHGLAIKHNDKYAFGFPASGIAKNYSLPGQINRLTSELNLPVTELGKIGTNDGPSLYRFQVINLIRIEKNNPPVQLIRGGKLLPGMALTSDEINRITQQWAGYLIKRQRKDGRFVGTYLPSADRYDPITAKPVDAALACYSLARYARSGGIDQGRSREIAAAARAGLDGLLSDLLPRDENGNDISGRLKLAPVAMALIALLETPGTSDLKPQRSRLAGALSSMLQTDGRFATRTGTGAGVATLPSQSLGGFGFVKLYSLTRDPADYQSARKALDAIWQTFNASPPPLSSTPLPSNNSTAAKLPGAGALPGGLPWLAKAEFALAEVGKGSPSLFTLQVMMTSLWDQQVTSGEQKDEYIGATGGFKLEKTLMPEPNWHSARLLAAQGAGLSIKNFVPQSDQPNWILNTSLGLRFLAQLTMQGPDCYYVRNRTSAIGGVRLALYDNRQPISATAMSLLAAVELQDSLKTLAENNK